MNIFWHTISEYNSATWGIQIAASIVGAVLTGLLFSVGSDKCRIAMKIYMAAVCVWISLVYYGVFCAVRPYSTSLGIFWFAVGIAWIYDIFGGYSISGDKHKLNWVAALLMLAPVVYPLLSLACGRSFPEMTSPIMPCSVAVFSVGILLSFERRINLVLIMLLLHWAILSIPKTRFYGIPEDYFLSLCTIPALYLFLDSYITQVVKPPSKPSVRFLKFSMYILCAVVGAFFSTMILKQFGLF